MQSEPYHYENYGWEESKDQMESLYGQAILKAALGKDHIGRVSKKGLWEISHFYLIFKKFIHQ